VVGFVVLAVATGVFFVWALPGVAGLRIVSTSTESQVSGNVTKWVARNSDDGECTATDEWLDIEETEVTFHTTGFHKRALILFQASWLQDDGQSAIRVRALIDGEIVDVGDDEFVAFFVDQFEHGTHGFNWISEELHPGSHTAVIQWFWDAGGAGCLDQRSTIVQTS
jgi:hypothetical protein